MAYDYVRRQYGVAPVPGERVRHKETGKFGTICRCKAAERYVHVRFDGDRLSRPCHPEALDYLTEGELARLITVIERELEEAGGVPAIYDHDAWKAYHAKADAIVARLVANEGAKYRSRRVADAAALKLASVSTSCTGGTFHLLTNWQNAAHRRIECHAAGGAS